MIAKVQRCEFMRGIPFVPKARLRLMSSGKPGQLFPDLTRIDQGAQALEDFNGLCEIFPKEIERFRPSGYFTLFRSPVWSIVP